MCALHKEIVFPLSDLCVVEVACGHCQTKVTLDMRQFESSPARPYFAPAKCPACGTAYDSAVASLNAFREAWVELAKVGAGVVGRLDANGVSEPKA
jgi:hypothetical protein